MPNVEMPLAENRREIRVRPWSEVGTLSRGGVSRSRSAWTLQVHALSFKS